MIRLLALAVSGRGLVDPDEPVLHADDEGFLRGRAAFETVRVYGGRPFRLDEHLARLAGSAARLGLPPFEPAELHALASDALACGGASDCSLRFYWTPGRFEQGQPLALVLVQTLPDDLEELRERGLRLVTLPVGLDAPGLMGGVKSTSYALNMTAIDEARRRGADDALLVGSGGVVLEGPTSNVWWRRGQTLSTPSLDLGILAGVTRGVILEISARLGYDVRQGTFLLDELMGAEEAFATSSVREVMPIAAVDGAPLGAGLAADRLQRALRELSEVKPNPA